jgi:hypothetical protein
MILLYIYANHLGGLYASNELKSYDDLLCETCGDCDTCLGIANNKEEALKLIGDDYTEEYVQEFLNKYFSNKKDNKKE